MSPSRLPALLISHPPSLRRPSRLCLPSFTSPFSAVGPFCLLICCSRFSYLFSLPSFVSHFARCCSLCSLLLDSVSAAFTSSVTVSSFIVSFRASFHFCSFCQFSQFATLFVGGLWPCPPIWTESATRIGTWERQIGTRFRCLSRFK